MRGEGGGPKSPDLGTEAGEERHGFSGGKLGPAPGHVKSSRPLPAFCCKAIRAPGLPDLPFILITGKPLDGLDSSNQRKMNGPW